MQWTKIVYTYSFGCFSLVSYQEGQTLSIALYLIVLEFMANDTWKYCWQYHEQVNLVNAGRDLKAP
jgi:hypothetical protein